MLFRFYRSGYILGIHVCTWYPIINTFISLIKEWTPVIIRKLIIWISKSILFLTGCKNLGTSASSDFYEKLWKRNKAFAFNFVNMIFIFLFSQLQIPQGCIVNYGIYYACHFSHWQIQFSRSHYGNQSFAWHNVINTVNTVHNLWGQEK